MAAPIRRQPEKLRELLLYVARASEQDPRFGVTKLNKILFFCDFLAYLKLGQPITGVEYQKLEQGPAPRSIKPLLSDLVAGGALVIRDVDYYGRKQHRPIAKREPILGQFSPAEIRLVSEVIRALWPLTASAISYRSHGFIGWKVVGLGETIPYQSALIGVRTPTEREREYGISLEAEALSILNAR